MQIFGSDIYVETHPGKGNKNFLLIHNAGSDHRFFKNQIESLKPFGQVTLFDLPGSGKSHPVASYKMNDLAALTLQICEQLSLKNLSLIGLNNGANIAIQAALQKTVPIEKLILIDPPIFLSPSFTKEIQAYIQSLENAQFDAPFVTSFVDSLFLQAETSTKEIAINAFNQVDKKALQALFQGLLDWDAHSSGLLKKIQQPTLCILTDEHHCSFEKMQREAPHFEIGKVIGSKCWATLEVPEQINAMITRFLKIHA